MPVTKTAKRALRGSKRKTVVNKSLLSEVEIAIRNAKKSKKETDVRKAISLTDRAKKKHFFHKNKASRIKSMLGKLVTFTKSVKAPAKAKKTSKK